MAAATIIAVARGATHGFSKAVVPRVRLIEAIGIDGDAHAGTTVKHRSRVAINPDQPNLRQVHLLAAETIDTLAAAGFALSPGDIGENILTRGIDLLALPTGTRLQLGADAIIEITGLRNPCVQLDRFQRGLTAALIDRSPDGDIIRKAGVMAIIVAGGDVIAGDAIAIHLPPLPHRALRPV